MNLMILFIAVGVFAFVAIIGGGIGLFIWYKSRNKKQTWSARCYQKSEGIITHKTNMGNLKLNDLIPYAKDRIEKIQHEDGRKIYRLVKLNITIQEITADSIERWGKDKEVNVLIEEDQATIIKKGYDNNIGSMIWKPMPRERIEMIKSDMSIQLKRVQQEKSFLASVIPFITIAISILGLLGCAIFMGDSFVKVATTTQNIQLELIESQEKVAKDYLKATEYLANKTKVSDKLYLNNGPEPNYPSIE